MSVCSLPLHLALLSSEWLASSASSSSSHLVGETNNENLMPHFMKNRCGEHRLSIVLKGHKRWGVGWGLSGGDGRGDGHDEGKQGRKKR